VSPPRLLRTEPAWGTREPTKKKMASAATLDLIEEFNDTNSDRRRTFLNAIRPKLAGMDVEEGKMDDDTLVRFGIARGGQIEPAAIMLKAYDRFRRDVVHKVVCKPSFPPTLYPVRGFDVCPDGNINTRDFPDWKWLVHHGSGAWHYTSKVGYPIVIENIGKHNAKGFAQDCPKEQLLEWHVRINEVLFGPIMEEASKRAGKKIDKILVIFDMNGTGLHQLNPSGLAVIKGIVDCDQQYYPERLGQLFIINAPSLFSMGWRIISTWLDPRVLEKIQILGKDYQETLLKYVDASALPKIYGGQCECKHMTGGCVPPIEKK
jgi:hypothetical protein